MEASDVGRETAGPSPEQHAPIAPRLRDAPRLEAGAGAVGRRAGLGRYALSSGLAQVAGIWAWGT